MKITLPILCVLLFGIVGCNEDIEKLSSTGTITYMSLEGGFYGIITDKGDHYLPENLSSDFQKDSVRVYFEGIITDRPTTQQWGHTITLSRIDRIQ